jgi:hypothetical protein
MSSSDLRAEAMRVIDTLNHIIIVNGAKVEESISANRQNALRKMYDLFYPINADVTDITAFKTFLADIKKHTDAETIESLKTNYNLTMNKTYADVLNVKKPLVLGKEGPNTILFRK